MLRTILLGMAVSVSTLNAESKIGGDYPGVADPFADPAQYEFAEEEKEDKEFFHLGRFLMLGIDAGAGIFTGGLGVSAGAGMQFGARLVYFFDKALAFEIRGNYTNHLDVIQGAGGGLEVNTDLIGVSGAFRYYFDTRSAPRAIAIANPYLVAGGGVFIRTQTILANTTGGNPSFLPSTSFGASAGGGIEFLIYRRHVYLGVDLRYHLVFFPDENDTLGTLVEPGARGGDYVTTVLTLTYSF